MNDYCLEMAKKIKNYEETLIIHSINKQEHTEALQTLNLIRD